MNPFSLQASRSHGAYGGTPEITATLRILLQHLGVRKETSRHRLGSLLKSFSFLYGFRGFRKSTGIGIISAVGPGTPADFLLFSVNPRLPSRAS